jgi:transcriptional regulator with XRE-family HTH domain
MGRRRRGRDDFRNKTRDERERRGWSQAQMAKLLSDRGFPAHATTIAKIEAGDRSVQIDEAAAIADLFEVSLDTLVGRAVSTQNDFTYTLRSLISTARQAAFQIESTQTALRERVAELDTFEFPERDTLVQRCERALAALGQANAALAEVLRLPHDQGPVQDASLDLLLEQMMDMLPTEDGEK